MEKVKLKLGSKLLVILLSVLFAACTQKEKNSNDDFAKNIIDSFIETFDLSPNKGSISVGLSKWTDSSTVIDLSFIEKKYESEDTRELISRYRSFKISKNGYLDFHFLNDLKWKIRTEKTRNDNFTPVALNYDNIQFIVLESTRCVLYVGEGTTDSILRSEIIRELDKRNIRCK